MMVNLKRIFRFGLQKFWRQRNVCLSLIFTLTITLFAITSLFLLQRVGNYLIDIVQERVDIAVFFKKGTDEEKIINVEKEIKTIPDIKSIEYISEEEAFKKFKEIHKNDSYYLQALEELGDNPFLASLNIKAKNFSKYPQISNFLSNGEYKDIIEKISYFDNKIIIEKLFNFINTTRKFILIIFFVFSIFVILITINTVRLSIYSEREEIKTMKLVGAPASFLFGPFLIQGLIYILISIFLCNIALFLLLAYIGPKSQEWLSGFNLYLFFKDNFPLIFLEQFLFLVLLCFLSILFSVKKYSKKV